MRFSLLFLFVFSFLSPVKGQISFQLKSNDEVTTGYTNRIISSDKAYFILMSDHVFPSREKKEMVITKYDLCHNYLWSKRYSSNAGLVIDDAKWDQDRMVILSGSNQKQPFLTALDEDGVPLFHRSYRHSNFDNHHNLSISADGYDFFGPSNGPSRFSVDKEGKFTSADILTTNLTTSELGAKVPFGSATFSNQFTLRRYGNAIVGIEAAGQIAWAKQLQGSGGYVYSERQPVEVPGGFAMVLELESTCIVKLNFEGEIVWVSPGLAMDHTSTDLFYQNGKLTFVSLSTQNPTGQLAKIELNSSNGEIQSAQIFELQNNLPLSFPTFHLTHQEDLLITADVLFDFSNGIWEDWVFINPGSSDCMDPVNINTSPAPALRFTDVTSSFGLESITVQAQDHNLRVQEEEAFFDRVCLSAKEDTIQARLDCEGVYVFDNPYPGATYSWPDGRSDSIRSIEEKGVYNIKVSGCGIAIDLQLKVSASDCNCSYYIPNILHLNSNIPENANLSLPSNCGFELFEFSIYDRWGTQWFSTQNPAFSWNPKNQRLSSGVYVYRFRYRWKNQPEIKLAHGTLTILD